MSFITDDCLNGKKFPVKEYYNLPSTVIYCKECVISNQRPRIKFDENNVCSACNHAKKKKKIINWEDREKELNDLLDKHRRKDGYWDVVVPCSGGKDSAYVAHILKHKYKMNPLTVTWAPMLYTDVGIKNLKNMIDSGLDNIKATPNGKTHRLLTKLSLEIMGDVFQPFIYGQKSFPMNIAVNYKIPLIMYGEQGEVEYGGDNKNENSPTHDSTDDLVNQFFSGFGLDYFERYGLKKNKLNYYYPPSIEKIKDIGIENHYFGYYKKWIPQNNYYYVVENCDFEPEPKGRSEGTYSKYASIDDKLDGYHYYFALLKFGHGRATSDAAHEIRDGHITREEAIALVKKYDHELPVRHFKEFLNYVDLTENEFYQVCERFRADHIWEKKGNDFKKIVNL
jgi:N-acetyl sugar amidotransferase